MPSRAATWAAVLGQRSTALEVATTTRSTSEGSRPAAASALPAAALAMSATVSSSAAMCRVAMPVRCRIQASLVSTMAARSSLVRTRCGWW